MSELGTGGYKIVSLTEGNPTANIEAWYFSPGVDPDFQHLQVSIWRDGTDIQIWGLSQQGDEQIFQFRIGKYPWTGVLKEKVIATDIEAKLDLKWHVTYRPAHDAYTIELNEDRSKGWTVTEEAPSNKRVVKIRSIAEELSPTQLFRFVAQS